MATKLKVNYEFVGDSTTPVTRTGSIKHGEKMLNTVINNLENYVTPQMFGAVGDGVHDDTQAINDSINYIKNKGGVLFFPSGTYITQGDHLVESDYEISIIGSGQNSTIIKCNSENYLFWFRNINNVIIPSGIKGMTIYGDNNNTCNLIVLSDGYGKYVKNVTFYDCNSSCIQLYNYKTWTEMSVIEDVMIRGCKYGITFKRSDEGTDSFFGLQVKRLYHSISSGVSRTIYLSTTSDKPINVYNANIDLTGWYEGSGGGKNLIYVDEYCFLSGNVNFCTDGIPNNANNNDFNNIVVGDNAKAIITGKNYNYQVSQIFDLNYGKIKQIGRQRTYWKKEGYKPLLEMHGYSIEAQGTVAVIGNEKTLLYNSDELTPYTTYKVTVIVNDYHTSVYIVNTHNLDVTIEKTKIIGQDDIILLQPSSTEEREGSYVVNRGLTFSILYENEEGAGTTETLSVFVKIEVL